MGFTKPRERVKGDRDENPHRNSPGMDMGDPGLVSQRGRRLPPSPHASLGCRARHGGAVGSPHPGKDSGGCPRAGGYCWMLLVSGGIPQVSPPARGGTVLQEKRVGGLGGLIHPPCTASGALWEHQGLQDVREGDDPFNHIALIHHHQPVDLGRGDTGRG